MQLEKSQVFGRGSIRRSIQKDGEVLDGADVVALGIGAEVADRHVFDHAPPQRADGRLAHRGLPLEVGFGHPSILETGRRPRHPNPFSRSRRHPPSAPPRVQPLPRSGFVLCLQAVFGESGRPRRLIATSCHSGDADAGLAGAAGAAGAGRAPIRPMAIVVIDGRPPPRRMLEPYITSVPGAQPTRSSSVMQTQVLVIAPCPSGWVHGFSPEPASDCTLKRPILDRKAG